MGGNIAVADAGTGLPTTKTIVVNGGFIVQQVTGTPSTPPPATPAMVDCLKRAPAANGLYSGQYMAPNFNFIFPENLIPGDPIVPNNFWSLGFLVNGEGPGTGGLVPAPW